MDLFPGGQVDGVVGRETELAILQAHLGAEAGCRTLALVGDPGSGKTTLLNAGIDAARERGMRVLVARPSGAEAQLAYATLIDLLDGVSMADLDLPGPQERALEVAILRADAIGGDLEPRAVAVAFVNALRAMSRRERLLVAIDDIAWLDAPSADVVTYAARRLENESVQFLLAKRPAGTSPLERALGRGEIEQLEVGPLSLGAIRRLLAVRLGLTLPRHVLRRVFDSTLGNPLLALELGRALVQRGRPPLHDDIPVPDTIEDLLGTRVARLPRQARMLLLATTLSADLRVPEVVSLTGAAALDEAVDNGVLVVEGGRVRPTHPLLAAAARLGSRKAERRQLHRELATVVADAELRALHLALATELPDPELAATVAAAAAAASARAARQEAATLAEHALRLTPPDVPERAELVLELAAYLDRAGELQRVTELLAPALDWLPPGGARVRAWLQLAEAGGVRSLPDLERHLEAALAEAGDDRALRAHVLAKKADHLAASAVAQIPQAEAWALEALDGAQQAGPEVERLAVVALGWARVLRGRPIDDLCDRFDAVSDDPFSLADSPKRIAAQRLVWRGDVVAAREAFTRMLGLADEQGEPVAYALQRLHLCEVELRAGGWSEAERLLDEWAESSEGELLVWPMYERCRAQLACGRGLPVEAERWAAQALARAETTGGGWDRLEALRARGTAELLAREPTRALESLRVVWAHTRREGVEEPGVFPVAPELVEALVELGELGEARAVASRLRGLARQQEHPWGLVTARRCDALIDLAVSRHAEEAAATLARTAADYGELGLRFDRARVLLALGRVQRRRRKWKAARESLQQAASAFEELRSIGWAEVAHGELARVGARRPRAQGQLTEAERRVVELAIEGRSNKEIAHALVVTVATVERHLSHAYAKLGVRSRAQLAGRLSTGA